MSIENLDINQLAKELMKDRFTVVFISEVALEESDCPEPDHSDFKEHVFMDKALEWAEQNNAPFEDLNNVVGLIRYVELSYQIDNYASDNDELYATLISECGFNNFVFKRVVYVYSENDDCYRPAYIEDMLEDGSITDIKEPHTSVIFETGITFI